MRNETLTGAADFCKLLPTHKKKADLTEYVTEPATVQEECVSFVMIGSEDPISNQEHKCPMQSLISMIAGSFEIKLVGLFLDNNNRVRLVLVTNCCLCTF